MIGFIDLSSLILTLLSLLSLLMLFRRAYSSAGSVSIFLKASFVYILLLLFHYLSNSLEWLEISDALDPYEDFIELFEPYFMFVIMYLYLVQISGADLKRSEERYRLILENQSDLIVKTDKNGHFLFVSRSYCEMFGKKEEELLGRKFMPLVHEDDIDRTLAEMEKLKTPPHKCYVEQRALTAKGWRWIAWSDKAVPDRDGAISYIIGSGRDVTDIRNYVSELREHQERLRSLSDNIPEGLVYQIDSGTDGTERKFTYISAGVEKLHGLKAEDVIRDPSLIYSQVHEYDRRFFNEKEAQAARNMDFFSCIVRVRNSKGEISWRYFASSPRKNPEGRIIWDGIEIDITQTKNSETALKQAVEELKRTRAAELNLIEDMKAEIEEKEKARNEIKMLNETLEQKVSERTRELEISNRELEAFSYSVSHDLRAPLRHIMGFADHLRNSSGLSGREAEVYLDKISGSAREMGTLVDDLLDYSRTGRSELKKINADIKNIVLQTVEKFKIGHPERNITWKIAELPDSVCDENLVRSVWTNLIDNAVKYTSKQAAPVIDIDFKEQDGKIEYSIKDNGAGFDIRYSDKLFGVFQRLHGRSEFGGTGIGLANVRRIIERHGGTVRAVSEGEGKGACFYFTLPK